MKRRHILLFLVCGAMLASCSSTTYTGEEDIQKPDVGYEQEPVPVTLRIGNASYVTETRSTGAFGSLSGENSSEADFIQWNNARFYVYAFAKGTDTDLSICWDDPENTDENSCLIDATRPGKKDGTEQGGEMSVLRGKETYIEQESYSYLYWTKEEGDTDAPVYYNVVDRERPYNFFAYYVDDAEVSNFRRTHDRIYFDVAINGQQDLMTSMATPTSVQIDRLKDNPNKDKILDCAFSAYSGNYDLSPVFEFEHHLTCLRFAIYPAGELEDGENSDCYRLEIASIKVVNPQTKGVFTVATNNPEEYPLGVRFTDSPEEGTAPILVQKKAVEEGNIVFRTTTGNLSESAPYWEEDKKIPSEFYYNRHGQDLEGSVLLAPQPFYTLEIRLEGELEGAGYEGETFKVDVYPPGEGETFESGKGYVVRLGVYGRQRIESDVAIGEWKPGGDIDLKPEG